MAIHIFQQQEQKTQPEMYRVAFNVLSSDNLAVHQDDVPKLMNFFNLITCLFQRVLIL